MFHRFIAYYRPYRRIFFADMLCVLIAGAVDLAFPQILRAFTSDLFLRPPAEIMHHLGSIGAALAAMYLVRYGCMYFTGARFTRGTFET